MIDNGAYIESANRRDAAVATLKAKARSSGHRPGAGYASPDGRTIARPTTTQISRDIELKRGRVVAVTPDEADGTTVNVTGLLKPLVATHGPDSVAALTGHAEVIRSEYRSQLAGRTIAAEGVPPEIVAHFAAVING